MRAVEPSKSGTVERDGLHIAYEVFGDGETTVVFVPIDTIVDSRAWKAQVPFLARRARVVTIDPRGNGRSGPADRPGRATATSSTSPTPLAVMDELGIEAAVLVGHLHVGLDRRCWWRPSTRSGCAAWSRSRRGCPS